MQKTKNIKIALRYLTCITVYVIGIIIAVDIIAPGATKELTVRDWRTWAFWFVVAISADIKAKAIK